MRYSKEGNNQHLHKIQNNETVYFTPTNMEKALTVKIITSIQIPKVGSHSKNLMIYSAGLIVTLKALLKQSNMLM